MNLALTAIGCLALGAILGVCVLALLVRIVGIGPFGPFK